MKDLIHQVKRLVGRMLLLAGVLVAGRALADGDTCYVESTSGTYIDTGYYPGPETKIEVDFQFTEVKGYTSVFGVNDSDSLSTILYVNGANAYSFSYNDGGVSGQNTGIAVDTKRHTAIFDSYNGGAQDGVVQLKTGDAVNYNGALSKARTKQSAYPLHFFAENNRTAEDFKGAKMRFYGAKIYEKGELVRDYIPYVRNGIVGIKDLVTGAFLYPTDMALLTAGAGVTSETTNDGYLESAGDGSIDTGYKPTPNTRIEADFEMVATDNVAQPRVFGSSGLQYELYFNSRNWYAFNAIDVASPSGVGYLANWGDDAPADIGVRHTFFVDHYRKRAAFQSAGKMCAPKDLTTTMTAAQASGSLRIFSDGSGTQNSKVKLYGFRIFESGKLVHDYVPCVQDGANGLFDQMTEQFITFGGGVKGSVGGDVLVREDKAYVESTSSTYIDMGYYPGPETKIEVDFRFTEVKGYTSVFGVNDPDSLSTILYVNGSTAYSFSYNDGGMSGQNTGLAVDTTRHTAIFDSYNGGAQNGIVQLKTGDTVNYTGKITTTRTKRSAYPLHFFAENNRTAEDFFNKGEKMRFYGAKIYEKGELVRDYIPYVRNGIVGIKDLVTGAFLYPTDLSVLTAGEGVTSETTNDGYLESTGADYIDTGYKPTPNTRIEADFEMVETNNVSQPRVFGSSGLRYELYFNSLNVYTVNAYDEGSPSGVGYLTRWDDAPADVGVRHTFIVDHYRKRAALQSAGKMWAPKALTTAMTATEATGSLFIFSGSGVPRSTAKAKLYGLRIFESGLLVHDYVPCVQDDLNGLYDKVTGQFLGYGCGKVGGDVMKCGTDACLISDGTQGIVSDYFVNPNSKIVVDFSYNNVTTTQQRVFGADSESSANPLSCSCYLNSVGNLAYCFSDGIGVWTSMSAAAADMRYVITLDSPNGKVSVKGGAYDYTADMTSTRTQTSSQPLGIFIGYENGFTRTGGDIRLYSLKCYENGVLVRQYLPYKSGDTLGLYETVTGKVFLNTRDGAHPFEIKGMGTDGSGSALLAKPKDARVKWSKPAVLKAFAPGAIAYRWFEGDTEIVGETGAELSVARQDGRELVTYSVKPVFEVNGKQIEGEAASATVNHQALGMMIMIK